MRFITLDTDTNYREMTHHGYNEFPVALYLRHMNREEEGNLVLHWHDEIQFVVCLKGPIDYRVCDTDYVIEDNDCLFINSKCLHAAKPMDKVGGDFICIDVHPYFIYSGNSLLNQKYVQPVLTCNTLQSILFDGSAAWHDQVRKLLHQIIELEINEEFGYELEMQSLFTRIWSLILKNHREQIENDTLLSPKEKARLDNITSYIDEHYKEHLTLTDIADAASICTAECCRFMKKTLGYSPMIYLNNYRIIKSTELLKETEMSIADIAQSVGFTSSSYYTERFKKLMNCKPLDYRRNQIVDRKMKESPEYSA